MRRLAPLDRRWYGVHMTLTNGGYSVRDLRFLTFVLTRELRSVRDMLYVLPVRDETSTHAAWVDDMLRFWEKEYDAIS